MCAFSRKTTFIFFPLSQFFFFDLKNSALFSLVLKCSVIEGAQVIIIETSIEKIHILNERFKLPYVLGWLKMIEVIPPCIYHSNLSPYQRPAKDTKVMAFLINLCDRSKLPAFFVPFFPYRVPEAENYYASLVTHKKT